MIQTLIFILICLLFSVLLSFAEIAFVSSSKLLIELEKMKGKKLVSSILGYFYSKPNQFLTSLLIGNVILLVIYGLLMIDLLNPLLYHFLSADWLVLFLQVIVLTLFFLLIKELVLRVVSNTNLRFLLPAFAIPLLLIYILIFPLSQAVSGITWVFSKLFGTDPNLALNRHPFHSDNLDYFIHKTMEESSEKEDLDKEVRLFQNAMDFSRVKIRNCIVPRTGIVALEQTVSMEELLDRFVETGLSKIIVYNENIDNIVGYIHSTKLFNNPKDWRTKINSLIFVPENMPANKLMKNMLAEKKNMAVVVDEFGGTAGVVTLEDLVEEIFGEIEDEHDTAQHVAKQLSKNEFILSGRIEIDKANELFQLGIPESDEYLTIAGYILNFHPDFPLLNETIPIDRFTFQIIQITNTKIELVRLKVN